MIFLGKFGVRPQGGEPTPPLFVLYLQYEPYDIKVGLPDGSVVPFPRPASLQQSAIDLDELARAAAAEILPGSGGIPSLVLYARSSRIRTMDPPQEPEGGNDDYTPLGRHVLDLSQADFSGLHFNKADFRGAKLAGVKLTKARLAESRFDAGALAGLDLSGADLTGASFSKFDFTGTNFSGANLTAVTLDGCTIAGTKFNGAVLATRIKGTLNGATFAGAIGVADFSESTLVNCDFTNAVLPGSNFSGATLDRGTYKATLSLARFTGAKLDRAVFTDANLQGAMFGGDRPAVFSNSVDLGGADVALADFSKTSLTTGKVKGRPKFGATIDTRTRFAGATIDAAFLGNDWSYLDCAGAKFNFAADFGKSFKANYAILTGCNFSGKELTGAEFKSALLQGASFANCDLEDSNFVQAVLGASSSGGTGADFTGARLCLADFTDADLSGVTFASTNLQGAKFVNALVQQTDFTNAFAAEVDFQKIRDRRMQGVSFVGACLVSATFKETTLSVSVRASSFSGALLMGTSFESASLADAVLTNAKLSKVGGAVKAKLKPLPGEQPDVVTLNYQATRLDPAITGARTHCPNGDLGPCTVANLTTDVPAEWTQP